jgi:hypothetical protein
MADQRNRKASLVFTWAARIFAAMIAVQVFLAGLALFVNSHDWMAHSYFARGFIIFPVFMLLLSFIARLPVSYRIKSIQLLVMVILMFVTAELASHLGVLSALHPVIAVGMFWSAMTPPRLAAGHTGSEQTGPAAGKEPAR